MRRTYTRRLAMILILCLIPAFSPALAEEPANRSIFSHLSAGRSDHNRAHLQMINAYEAWDKFENYLEQGEGPFEVVNVGVIDTRFFQSHPDLRFAETFANSTDAEISDLMRQDSSSNSPYHGTHVSGILGAIHQNGLGIDGMYPLANEPVSEKDGSVHVRSHLYAVSMHGGSQFDDYRDAIEEMLRYDVKVINISMGITPSEEERASLRKGERGSLYDEVYLQSIIKTLETALNAGKDFVIVVSAGNKKVPATATNPFASIPREGHEALYDRILVVGNCRTNYTMYTDSNYGLRVDVVAPGEDVYSTMPNGEYKALSGTSMSAPFVSGTAAMLWCVRPDATGDQIKKWILDSAQLSRVEDKRTGLKEFLDSFFMGGNAELSHFDADYNLKYRLLNAEAALDKALESPILEEPVPLEGEGFLDGPYQKKLAQLIGEFGVMGTEWLTQWTEADLVGLLAADIRDFDGDNLDDLLTVGFRTHAVDWYGQNKQVLDVLLTMYHYDPDSGSIVQGDSLTVPVSPSFAGELMIAEQINCFLMDEKGMVYIVLDDHISYNDEITTLATFYYWNDEFHYSGGLGFGDYGYGNLFVYAREGQLQTPDQLWSMDCSGSLGGGETWQVLDSRLVNEDTWEEPTTAEATALYNFYLERMNVYGFGSDDMRLRIRRDYSAIERTPGDSRLFAETVTRYNEMTAKDVYSALSDSWEEITFLASVHAFFSLVETDAPWQLRRRDYSCMLDPWRVND